MHRSDASVDNEKLRYSCRSAWFNGGQKKSTHSTLCLDVFGRLHII
ncbi:MAG: hypothetical protein KAJ63_03835 [Methyloprofundus sp.]|nr:hypothetical protein [Methyloprofundus sp.]